jgi:hydroxymethylglutaryl-CoA lyase
VVVFGAASEAFSQRNINCSIAESIERFRRWWPRRARPASEGARRRVVRGGLPYQGEVSADEWSAWCC